MGIATNVTPINFTLLGGVCATVVEGGVDGLALDGATNGPIFRQSVLDLVTDAVLEKRALDDAIGGPNVVVVARSIRSGQCNW